jgi:hypothetical protein
VRLFANARSARVLTALLLAGGIGAVVFLGLAVLTAITLPPKPSEDAEQGASASVAVATES